MVPAAGMMPTTVPMTEERMVSKAMYFISSLFSHTLPRMASSPMTMDLRFSWTRTNTWEKANMPSTTGSRGSSS